MKYRKNEKGAALLLALGFAALLLVLVMGFVTNALIERKVASTNADRTETKNIAVSALNRAIAAMTYLSSTITEDTGLHRFDNIVSKNTENIYSVSSHHDAYITAIPSPLASPYSNTQNFGAGDVPKFSGLNDIFAARTYNGRTHYLVKNGRDLYLYKYPVDRGYDYNENQNTLPSGQTAQELIFVPRQPQWQYVRQNGANPPWSSSNPRSPVIGRFLYAVLPDMGKFSADAFRYNTQMSGSNIVDSAIARVGREIREFSVAHFMPLMRAAFDSDVDFSHSATTNDIFYYTNGEPFFRTSQAFDVVMRAGLSDSAIADSAFELSNMVEPLLFGANTAGTGLAAGNLNQNFRQGSPYTTHSMLSVLQNSGGTIGIDSSFPTTVLALQNAIPYLNKIDTDATVRNQIAANIIEIFANGSGNVLSGDNNGNVNVFDSTTTYTGNRRTPYIGEIELGLQNFEITANKSAPDPDNNNEVTVTSNAGTVKLSGAVELFDPFGLVSGDSDWGSFSLDFVEDPKFMLALKRNESSIEEKEITISPITTVFSYDSKISGLKDSSNNVIPGNLVKINFSAAVNIDAQSFGQQVYSDEYNLVFYIKSLKCNLKYNYNGGIVDFVKNLEISSDPSIEVAIKSEKLNEGSNTISVADSEKVKYFRTKNPLCNLDVTDTNLYSVGLRNSTDPTDIGSVNPDYSVPELNQNAVDRLNYIANNRDKITLADFGLISRGRPGETLQIHSVGATSTADIDRNINNNTNDIRYTNAPATNPTTLADGGLLDQITTVVDTTPQLIDINTRSVAVWRSLLSNIRDDVTTANPTPGYILDSAQAQNLARKISYNIRNNNEFFKSRSGFIAVFNNSLGTVNGIGATTSNITGVALSDREKQIIIGKMLPLCKTEDYPEFIQVIVVAQKIKDIGGYVNDNPSNNFVVGDNFGSFEYGRDQIVSEVRLLAKIRRTGNEFKIISIEELID